MKITAILPVYKDPKLTGDIIKKLINNHYKNKEIIVIIDGKTNSKIEDSLKDYRDKIRIIYNHKHLGKVRSLNNIAFKIPTDILLFIDNDIQFTNDVYFLNNLADEFEKHDIVELPKEAITRSIFSGMIECEFLSFAIACFIFSRLAKRCPSMNGAAFAIKKNLFLRLNGFNYVINEDMDLASRAFMMNAKYSYNPRLKVKNHIPKNLDEWLIQRKRWAMNNVLWLKNNFFLIIKNFFRDPDFRKSTGLLFLPFLIFMVIYYILHKVRLTAILPFLIIIGMHIHILIGLFLGLAQFQLVTENIISVFIGYFVTMLFYFIFSRILNFKFNFFSFFGFYFFYSPVWLISNIIFGILLLLNIKIKIDWKISR